MDDSEDLIEDDYDSYDELFTQHFTNDDLSLLDEAGATSIAKYTQSQQIKKPVSATKRFLLPSKSSPHPDSSALPKPNKEDLPWAQRYAPLDLEELAVHKRKVRDVEQWLDDALARRPCRGILVLKGPAGSGKTTTIKLLADKLKYSILEWRTPAVSEYATKGYVSLGAQFDDFLNRGHTFGSLDLDGTDGTDGSQSPRAQESLRRIILIEEFPTLTGRNASVLAAFRLSLLRHISNARRSLNDTEIGVPPIVIVVSETFSNTDFSFDSLTVHRLLGREICHHPSTRIIEFNSIAPTIMHKALDLVVKKSARNPKALASTLESLSQAGDIRNAIASLEFVLLDSGNQGFHQGFQTKTSSRTRKKTNTSVSDTQITQRESSLGLFHAVGKIVYNKRSERPDTKQSRLHLPGFDRPEVSEVHVNKLFEETGTDIQSFISALHENYAPSCNGSLFTESLDNCIEALSDSDLLCTDRKGVNRSRAGFGISSVKLGSSVDMLRQEELSYQVAARGLLFSLPFPVRRHQQHSKGASFSHKLSFPPIYRLQRHMEEVQAVLDQCIGTLIASSARPTVSSREEGSSFDDGATTMTLSSRNDLLLYQLPFMSMILDDGADSEGRERITTFSTLKDGNPGPSSQVDEPSAWGSFSKSKHDSLSLGDEQLILSDDEIVDDEP
ncbi:Rad17 cell cycle checkpoint protein-domain-containing protein [Aspergillus keveii]|uniref:Rad17 cell cycle checkpoint protein-domain-containing protein n=1 Tax=Aspergillus keveii TaxID=714993 RepID=A0ABR4GEN0_9EURO